MSAVHGASSARSIHHRVCGLLAVPWSNTLPGLWSAGGTMVQYITGFVVCWRYHGPIHYRVCGLLAVPWSNASSGLFSAGCTMVRVCGLLAVLWSGFVVCWRYHGPSLSSADGTMVRVCGLLAVPRSTAALFPSRSFPDAVYILSRLNHISLLGPGHTSRPFAPACLRCTKLFHHDFAPLFPHSTTSLFNHVFVPPQPCSNVSLLDHIFVSTFFVRPQRFCQCSACATRDQVQR